MFAGDEIDTTPLEYETSSGEKLEILYQSAASTQFSDYEGSAATYPGGGHVVDLNPTNETAAKEMLDLLFENRFIDQQSRALFIDFTTFNGNVNKFCNIRVVFELANYGGVKQTMKYAALKLYRYSSVYDNWVLSFEICLLILMFFYVDVQAQKIANDGFKEYISDFWTCFDLLNFVTMFLVVALRGYWINVVYGLQLNTVTDDEFVNLYDISQFVLMENGFSSINSLMIYLRAFKFFQLNPRFKTFQDVWGRAGMDLWAFWNLLFITLFSYTMAMYVCFSTSLEHFSTLGDSFMMIVSYLVGSYNMEEMRDAAPFLGTFYVLTFMLQVFFCLMNIPMIILGDSYAWAYNQKPKRELMNYVREELQAFIVANVSCLAEAAAKAAAAEERARLMDGGDIINDVEQARLMKQIDYVILEIGGEDEWLTILEAQQLDHLANMTEITNVTKQDFRELTKVLNSFNVDHIL